jgi:RHS repeat-associated protein
MMGFAYGYSVHNELTSADYSTFSNTGVPSSSSAYDESFTYDVRGNINTLLRNDQNGLSIDNLQYFYNTASNRSKSVYDHAVNIAGHNNNGKALGADIYSYDINGNLTTDPYRGVINILYNHLDLPTTIAKSGTYRMALTYDATGRLLTRKTYTTSSSIPSETREYIGPFEYVNGTLDFIQTSQGRYKNISGNLRHEYVINDHLGSARIWYADVNNNGFTDQSEILDENHYYAYGMEMQGSFINSTGFNYKFNGIERVESYNMDFALYRGLDPVLGKWYQVDPKAEQAGYHMSPYCAMNNNPVTYADPEGDIAPLAVIGIYAGVNVLMNAINGNINSVGDFAKHAAIGAVNGAISLINPLQINIVGDFGLSIAPQLSLGTDGVGFGFNATLGYQAKGFSAGINFGGSYYGSAVGTGASGFEGRFGYGISQQIGNWGYAAIGINNFYSGETSQSTGFIAAGHNKDYNYTFDNDIFGDGGDRFRTAGNRLRLGNFEVGLNMFTGDPGLKSEDRVIGPGGPNGTYEDLAGNSPNKYRFGGFYVGYRSNRNTQNFYRVGANSEWIRERVQNYWIHKSATHSPYFKNLGGSWKFYGGIYSSNPYTTW